MSATPSRELTTPISAVATTLSIIESMADHAAPVGVSELATLVAENKPRTYRHLRTLVEKGYVSQDPETEKYGLTLKLFHLGQSVMAEASFVKIAREHMAFLREATQHTVTIGQVEDHGVRILDILRFRSAIEVVTPPGTLFDFHSSAQGKIALAFDRGVNWPGGKLKRHTEHTCTEVKKLKAEVEQVRKNGWAVAPGEALIGINALAAPVFDAQGDLVGTITIVGSVQHLHQKPSSRMITAVRNAAANISARLGYQKTGQVTGIDTP